MTLIRRDLEILDLVVIIEVCTEGHALPSTARGEENQAGERIRSEGKVGCKAGSESDAV
jgi:hypothetical protein